jgi:CxxC motif-containing protein (DUF1111 family)
LARLFRRLHAALRGADLPILGSGIQWSFRRSNNSAFDQPGRVGETIMKKSFDFVVVRRVLSLFFVLAVGFGAVAALAQRSVIDNVDSSALDSLDPGPRGGSIGAGGAIAFSSTEQALPGFFQNGLDRFQEQESVSVPGGGANGLGPTFNSDSCVSCHSQPSPGGTSPSVSAYPFVGHNPQFTVGQVMGGSNRVPFFVLPDGPVREARFKSDSGVHDLFTIAGRTDMPAPNRCSMSQPNFEAENDKGNLSFRIPTPVFGAGMIENISDDTIMANLAASANTQLGIAGVPNRSGNDGTITRFGWKAQNKSLVMFAGEAYNVEMGVTNELFPSERGYPTAPVPAGCLINPTPEDGTNFASTGPTAVLSDISAFANFMRLLDQPVPACTGAGCSAPIQAGRATFSSIGCANCHTPSLRTAPSGIAGGLSQVRANLFSDLALHHMGTGLADGITQGNAGPDQFRTSPLWGVGQRAFFLHDGRTSNLVEAILAHQGQGSEANQVVNNFQGLSRQAKQNLILFLRSL